MSFSFVKILQINLIIEQIKNYEDHSILFQIESNLFKTY
jgi:hypothetical protein